MMIRSVLQQLIQKRDPVKPAARLIVCEQGNHWAVSMVRADRRLRAILCETRSLEQMRDALAISPKSLLGIELTVTNFDDVLETLIQLNRNYPRAVAVILATRQLKEYQWVLRQAGAIDFLVSTRRLSLLAEMTIRHVNLVSARSTVAQTIWQRLPWRPQRDTNKSADGER